MRLVPPDTLILPYHDPWEPTTSPELIKCNKSYYKTSQSTSDEGGLICREIFVIVTQ